MRKIDFLFSILAVLVIVLEILFYILFELHNAWPYNDDIFAPMQAMVLSGIGISTFFSLFFPRPYISVGFLVLPLVAVTLISKSGLNLIAIAVNFIAILLIFILTMKIASLRAGKVSAS